MDNNLFWFWTNMVLAFTNAYFALSGNTIMPRFAAFAFGLCFAAAMLSLYNYLSSTGVLHG